MLVVDAGAVIELLLGRPAAAQVEHHAASHGYELHAPQLLDIEVIGGASSSPARCRPLGPATLSRTFSTCRSSAIRTTSSCRGSGS